MATGRSDLAAQLERVRLESDTLYAIISAVGSSVDLTRVLDGIVELVTEATDCHACFIYLRDGDRLRIRAASRMNAGSPVRATQPVSHSSSANSTLPTTWA